jgi:D-galactarolactone cycloisomerase
MSVIRDIALTALEYRLPGGRAYGMARGLTDRRSAGIIVLTTEDGIEGIGESWGPPSVTRAYLALLRDYFIGTSIFAQHAVAQTILAKHYHLGTRNQLMALLSGIDIAALDAIGKRFGVSVADLLGGRLRTQVPVYASGGYLTAEDDQDAALARQLEVVADGGFSGFKIKLGRNPAEDAARCALARRILGDRPLLMVDANGNYTVDAARASMRAISEYDVHWYEEPLAPEDWPGYAELRDAPIPVATGEALYALFDFRRLIDGRLARIVQPDLSLCGGFHVGQIAAALCGAEHLRLSPHVWGSGVGLAAAAHFVAALPSYPHTHNVPFPVLIEYDVGDNALRDSVLSEPLDYRDGLLSVPEGPGLGVSLHPDVERRFGS